MHLINFEIKKHIKVLALSSHKILLPDIKDAKVELVLGNSIIHYMSLNHNRVTVTFDISDERYEILTFGFGNRRSAMCAKKYLEDQIHSEVTQDCSFPIMFENLDYIEHEHFEDVSGCPVEHEVRYYDIYANKMHYSDEPYCTSVANRQFVFKHSFEMQR